ncbi:MAG: TIGR03118 family protein, partial [Terriglobales bacterium]
MKRTLLLFGLLMTLAIPSGLLAQQAGYFQTNLVSNTAGVATTTDPQLLNPWGISVLPGEDFWIADNNSGVSTLYDQNGNKESGLVVTIPGATKNPNGNCSPGCPTGTVANASGSYFSGGSFIFDTEDGLVVYWNGSSNTAIVGRDNSATGAVYKGLALLGTDLLAANFNSGKVDVYDQNYNPTSLGGSFTDPNLPAGFAPHGIHVINNQVYIAYAMQDAPKHDAVPGVGAGQV